MMFVRQADLSILCVVGQMVAARHYALALV
jgi:hypothetical protein